MKGQESGDEFNSLLEESENLSQSLLKPNTDFVRKDGSISSTTSRDLNFCFDVILKEAVKEEKLVKQICYVMLSAYTSRPFNLSINAPSGEGKTYVLTTVGDLFPKTDIIYIAGMSSKAIFHKNGYLGIRDEDGEYVEVDDELQQLRDTIQDKKSELSRIKNGSSSTLHDTIARLEKEIEEDKQRIKEIERNAVKVIDLKNKILVFLDTPSSEIFEALMSLLSHDKYEVEYQFVDTSSRTGLKTRTNVLRGWPSVIFAQAIDFTHHPRYQEIQRRFIITNPRMDVEKYHGAVDLIFEKNCNPDFVYQRKIVSDAKKDNAREIILNIKDDLLSISSTIMPGKNNTLIPFARLLEKLLPTTNSAQDMTFTNRLLQHIILLANIHFRSRPYMEILPAFSSGPPLRIPMATYSDLQESISLMNNNVGGIRPYVLDWYHYVFFELYGSKSGPNSKSKNGEIITEPRIALTTNELIEKTVEVIKKPYSTKQILTEFIYPLLNMGYIDWVKSEIDGRAHIYFPVIESRANESNRKNSNLFFCDKKNNLFECDERDNGNIITSDDKTQIISKVKEVINYYSEDNNLVTLRFADSDTTIFESMEDMAVGKDEDKNAEEIVDKYYSEFVVKHDKDYQMDVSQVVRPSKKLCSSEEYLRTIITNNSLQETQAENIKNSINNQNL